ncbi:unnamed protein product [Rodentolepis nana]|uniref:RING-type E3 ubiquitin transferase n=1 Tax=Rodentolepis nana TaxID=102285 RepID=A0A0R3TCE8_RODNA|nr:unnamed protein product [Rodentolepis nana]
MSAYSIKFVEPHDEFVVPHMQTCCLANSLAYKEVLKNPKLFYNWDQLPEEHKRAVVKHCGEKIRKLEEDNRQQAIESSNQMPAVDVPSPGSVILLRAMDLPPPCKFFHAGMCFKGEHCEFAHPTQRCKYFNAGFCQYGNKCHFRHDLDRLITSNNTELAVPTTCPFFLAGQCKYGDFCTRSHQIDNSEFSGRMTLDDYKAQREYFRPPISRLAPETGLQSTFKHSSVAIAPNPARPPVQKPTTRLEQGFLRDLTPDDLDKMRNLEVDRFLKLYTPSHLKQTSDPSEKTKIFSLLFSSKDPDWTFEVKQILLTIILPKDYPVSPPIVSAPRTSDIPDSVTSALNEAISQFIRARCETYSSTGKVGLYLRSFFFWLDKSLKDIFTNAYSKIDEEQPAISSDLRIPESFHESILSMGPSFVNDRPESKPLQTERPKASDEKSHVENEECKTVEEAEEVKNQDITVANVQLQELIFEGLEMRGHAGTGLITRLPVQCICSICKLQFDWTFRLPPYNIKANSEEGEEDRDAEKKPQVPRSLTSLPPSTTTCQRCRHVLGMVFTAEYVHSFGSRIGTFEMANCMLVEVYAKTADVMLSCNHCNGEEFKVTGLQPDRVLAKRCQKCHVVCGIFYTGLSISRPKLASADICKLF